MKDCARFEYSSYKYGVLHLYSGFLLLLKERLARHYPELIFSGSMTDVKRKLEKNKIPNTVDLSEALERLDIGPRVVFSERDIECIGAIQKFRNAFEHYQVSVNPYHLWANLSRFLRIIDEFLVNHLNIRLEESVEHEELYRKIQEIEQVWQRIAAKRESEWQQEMQDKLRQFQAHREKVLTSLEFEYRRSKGAEPPFINCPECYQETLSWFGEYKGICVGCDNFFHITTCDICGMPMAAESVYYGDVDWCDNCRARIENE